MREWFAWKFSWLILCGLGLRSTPAWWIFLWAGPCFILAAKNSWVFEEPWYLFYCYVICDACLMKTFSSVCLCSWPCYCCNRFTRWMNFITLQSINMLQIMSLSQCFCATFLALRAHSCENCSWCLGFWVFCTCSPFIIGCFGVTWEAFCLTIVLVFAKFDMFFVGPLIAFFEGIAFLIKVTILGCAFIPFCCVFVTWCDTYQLCWFSFFCNFLFLVRFRPHFSDHIIFHFH